MGRRYGPSRHLVDAAAAEQFAAAVRAGGADLAGAVPPTYSAVYCLLPILSELFADAEVGIGLDGLLHTSQSFEWPAPVRPGDEIESWGQIASIQARRGMTFLGLDVRATNQDGATVCVGRSTLVARAAA